MEYVKPTKKIIFTTCFLMAVIVIAELISVNVMKLRNDEVFSIMTNYNPEKVESLTKDLETNAQDVSKTNGELIRSTHNKYIAIKYLLLTVFCYFASCLLFYRLERFE